MRAAQGKRRTRTSWQKTGMPICRYAIESPTRESKGGSRGGFKERESELTSESSRAKNAVAALTKRLTHRNPNVQIFALEVSPFDACEGL